MNWKEKLQFFKKCMRTKNIISVMIILLSFGTILFYVKNYTYCSETISRSQKLYSEKSSSIAIMYETEANSGKYVETTDSSWPTIVSF